MNCITQKNQGLTLLECLIVMGLMVALFVSMSCAYHSFVRRNQLQLLINQFTDGLNYARDAAVSRQTTVLFCPNKVGDGCGSNWQAGILIIDKRTQSVLRTLPAIPNRYHLYWRSTLGDSDALQWRSDGFTRGQQGSFFLCANEGARARSAQIIILRTGRLRVVVGKIPACRMTS